VFPTFSVGSKKKTFLDAYIWRTALGKGHRAARYTVPELVQHFKLILQVLAKLSIPGLILGHVSQVLESNQG
jgi:hypothetical protein